ncbi:MAG: hypothetical protein GXY83_24485 [Rhodopirellula sp.]|nr:hypothetical protein [Rhodopirellula sp.]
MLVFLDESFRENVNTGRKFRVLAGVTIPDRRGRAHKKEIRRPCGPSPERSRPAPNLNIGIIASSAVGVNAEVIKIEGLSTARAVSNDLTV